MTAVFKGLGYGFGKCLKYYCFFSIPMIWAWLPLFAIENYLNERN